MNLDERARRAAASVREHAEAVDADAVLDRVRTERDRPRWLLPAGAAAAAVALVIAVVAVVLPRVDAGPVIDPVGSEDPVPTEEPSPDTTEPTEPGGGTASLRWQRVGSSVFEGPGDDRMRAVAHHPSGVTVAVGRRADGPGIWRRDPQRSADDPEAWREVAGDICGEASCELHDVAATGDGFVVVGMLDGLPKVWLSEDGLGWRRVDLQRSGEAAGETELTAVLGLGANEVKAFGAERFPDGGSRPVVFTSMDSGATWSEAPVDFGFEEAGAHVIDATAAGAVMHIGDGTSLLVEADGTWSPRSDGAWFPLDIEGEGDEFNIVTTSVHAIAPSADGLWMLGSVWTPDGQDGRVWRSTDGGTTWAAMPGDLGGPGDQHVTAVAIAGSLVVGYETDAEGRPRPAAWALRDDAWVRVDSGADAFDAFGAVVDAVQTDAHSAIMVGTTGGGADPNEGAGPADAVVWQVAVAEGGNDDGAPAASRQVQEEQGGQPMLELARLRTVRSG